MKRAARRKGYLFCEGSCSINDLDIAWKTDPWMQWLFSFVSLYTGSAKQCLHEIKTSGPYVQLLMPVVLKKPSGEPHEIF